MPYNKSSRQFRLPLLLIPALSATLVVKAQDSIREITLDTIVIKAYEQNREIRDVAAAVNFIGAATLQRFSPVSVLQAVNTTAGVRMEERSPGSYRFNIRGSALRSPFGVRNVKVYFNDIPFTDPGGNTYLNQLGFWDYRSLEIIKGPGSSLYGAGTGGVLLIESMDEQAATGAQVDYTAGSYGLQQVLAAVTTGTPEIQNRFSFHHLQSDGYRNHSRSVRDVLSWNGRFGWENGTLLRTTFLAGNLMYQTPGALNAAEFNDDPKRSRPAAGAFPSAASASAAIYQKTVIAGLSLTQQLRPQLQNKTVVYAAFTQMNNPAIRNYARNREPHAGSRTVFTWRRPLKTSLLTVFGGGELQRGIATFSIHKNAGGVADSLRTLDEADNQLAFVFVNAIWDLGSWTFTAGSSVNNGQTRFRRFFPSVAAEQQKDFKGVRAPRLAVLKKLQDFSIYASISEGFSPPSTTELLPTGSAINLDLAAEKGTTYDIGFRGAVHQLYFDVNAFVFSLTNTIVQRRTAGGGEFFINAGSTRQRGLETQLRYPIFRKNVQAGGMLWASHTWHHFRYKEFKQLANDFSGNRIPGIPRHTVAAGGDANWRGFVVTMGYFFSSRIPLNDANDAFADPYHLVSTRVGYEKKLASLIIRGSIGAENMLNQTFSLGNDINAAAGRYYNAAAERNYFLSLSLIRN